MGPSPSCCSFTLCDSHILLITPSAPPASNSTPILVVVRRGSWFWFGWCRMRFLRLVSLSCARFVNHVFMVPPDSRFLTRGGAGDLGGIFIARRPWKKRMRLLLLLWVIFGECCDFFSCANSYHGLLLDHDRNLFSLEVRN